MATDATGPTSPLGIPTIDPDADAPSGLGENSVIAAIDTLIAARVLRPAGIVSGEVAVWNGATSVRSSTVRINNNGQLLPTVTVSTLAGGPPTVPAPTDGDIWVATAVDANGTRWQFQYNAGSASTYKWEFIGGPPVRVQDVTGTAFGLTTWAEIGPNAGVRYTVVRAGDYEGGFYANGVAPVGSPTANFGIGLTAGGSPVAADQFQQFLSGGNNFVTSVEARLLAVAAAAVITGYGWCNITGMSTSKSHSWVRPVRIA